jgi:hypothetical protein
MKFWLNKKVIVETPDMKYQFIDQYVDETLPPNMNSDDLDIQIKDKIAEDFDIYWSYVNGMLTNFGSLTSQRIHMMLTMFVNGPTKFNKSLDDLESFLNFKVKEEMLEFIDGMYSLRRG